MKVLIVGSGGREHAIAASVAKSPRADRIWCAPGNAGIAEYAECVDIGAMEFDRLAAFAKENGVDLCIVGMDDPLVGGLVDVMEEAGIRTFGPKKNAAILEGSKAFSKDLMKKYNIPTAAYENFTDPDEAIAYLETAKFPIVLKADGLALGQGVLICQNFEEAKEGVKTIMLDKKFGTAGNEMVIEEFMTGREVSVLSFVDGKTIKTMTSAQDHKRAGDGDTGLNTGGMGTFSPSPFYTKEVEEFCEKYIYQPTVDAMAAEGRPFKGVIFFGLMLTADGPKVLEYNARFGDPEAQVVLPRMKNDIIEKVWLTDTAIWIRTTDGREACEQFADYPRLRLASPQQRAAFTTDSEGIHWPELNEDLSFDGLIIESHCNPDAAWSDASQQITPDVLDYVLNLLVIREGTQTTENLSQLRGQIDNIDEQLLELIAKRMRISREIGVYKKEHDMPILQSPRYNEILEKRSNIGEQINLNTEFVKAIFREIHEESVRQQMIIMNEQA